VPLQWLVALLLRGAQGGPLHCLQAPEFRRRGVGGWIDGVRAWGGEDMVGVCFDARCDAMASRLAENKSSSLVGHENVSCSKWLEADRIRQTMFCEQIQF